MYYSDINRGKVGEYSEGYAKDYLGRSFFKTGEKIDDVYIKETSQSGEVKNYIFGGNLYQTQQTGSVEQKSNLFLNLIDTNINNIKNENKELEEIVQNFNSVLSGTNLSGVSSVVANTKSCFESYLNKKNDALSKLSSFKELLEKYDKPITSSLDGYKSSKEASAGKDMNIGYFEYQSKK